MDLVRIRFLFHPPLSEKTTFVYSRLLPYLPDHGNIVGSIVQALCAKTYAVFDDVKASKWQAAEVYSEPRRFRGTCSNRLISEFAHTRPHLPRAYCLCIVSSLFIISQASAIIVSFVETLWVATLLLRLAYRSLFGSCPTITIEWFRMAHFSENLGIVSFAPR
ncbi:hypothetical protein OG21DRAFT_611267 [Imleria badia]|nr:hypothetical protein OG21DRAFT_611267 [Imleria badia]